MREIENAKKKMIEDLTFRLTGFENIAFQVFGKPQAEIEQILREELARRLVGFGPFDLSAPKVQ